MKTFVKTQILALLAFLPLGLTAQHQFTVKGKISSSNQVSMAYLTYKTGFSAKTDSAKIKNGAFVFRGTIDGIIPATLKLNYLKLGQSSSQPATDDELNFHLEPTTILLSLTDTVRCAKITGSKVNDDNAKYKAVIKSVEARFQTLMKEYNGFSQAQLKDTTIMNPILAKFIVIENERKAVDKRFAAENKNSYLGLNAFFTTLEANFDPEVAEPEFLKFAKELRETPIGKDIRNVIDGVKNNRIGLMAPDFTQYDPKGDPVKLSDFKGKYVLVDFWASWCVPCRAENSNVLAAYNKYKDQNFTVLGVSLDKPEKKDKWLKAVKEDAMPWTQVSDNKPVKNTAAVLYGVMIIPSNVLVDPVGKIIAKDLKGAALEAKLTEVFKVKDR